MRPRSEPTVIKLLLADTAVGHHWGTGHVGGRRRAVAVVWKPSPHYGSRHRGADGGWPGPPCVRRPTPELSRATSTSAPPRAWRRPMVEVLRLSTWCVGHLHVTHRGRRRSHPKKVEARHHRPGHRVSPCCRCRWSHVVDAVGAQAGGVGWEVHHVDGVHTRGTDPRSVKDSNRRTRLVLDASTVAWEANRGGRGTRRRVYQS
jgi:hypothetical protein